MTPNDEVNNTQYLCLTRYYFLFVVQVSQNKYYRKVFDKSFSLFNYSSENKYIYFLQNYRSLVGLKIYSYVCNVYCKYQVGISLKNITSLHTIDTWMSKTFRKSMNNIYSNTVITIIPSFRFFLGQETFYVSSTEKGIFLHSWQCG